jgi:uncharacterized protein with HEPN domain
MQRDSLLLGEMIDAAEQAIGIASSTALETLEADRRQRDALLWNFTVLGEAAFPVVHRIEEAQPGCPVGAPNPAPESDRPRLLVRGP